MWSLDRQAKQSPFDFRNSILSGYGWLLNEVQFSKVWTALQYKHNSSSTGWCESQGVAELAGAFWPLLICAAKLSSPSLFVADPLCERPSRTGTHVQSDTYICQEFGKNCTGAATGCNVKSGCHRVKNDCLEMASKKTDPKRLTHPLDTNKYITINYSTNMLKYITAWQPKIQKSQRAETKDINKQVFSSLHHSSDHVKSRREETHCFERTLKAKRGAKTLVHVKGTSKKWHWQSGRDSNCKKVTKWEKFDFSTTLFVCSLICSFSFACTEGNIPKNAATIKQEELYSLLSN